MNNVAIVGRLVKDPEVRYTDSQMAVARFTVAVDRVGKEKVTDFISCVAFGKSGEFVEKYFSKGKAIGITGRIQTGSYTNQEGKKVYTTDVVAERVEFVEKKGEKGDKEDVFSGFAETDDDLPF